MIFDIIGAINLEEVLAPPKDKILKGFSGFPWKEQKKYQRETFEKDGVIFHALSRPDNFEDYASNERYLFLLIGEIFIRWDSNLTGINNSSRLDASALLDLYMEKGLEFIKMVKGNYYVIIVDLKIKQTSIVSSRFVMQPFFYSVCDGTLFFSSSLGELAKVLPQIPDLDKASVLETVIFNFPMWERTFLQGVKRFNQGCIYTFQEAKINSTTHWDHRKFYDSQKKPAKDAMEIGSQLFSKSVNWLIQDKDKICASFTSGFDSRVLHSVMTKDRQKVLAYSFGIKGSINVKIPERICSDLSMPFYPVYLEEEYEQNFAKYAWISLILSDGLVVQRANYSYAFEKISDFSDVVITGLFGSEFLRTFQNLGTVVSEYFARINDKDGDLSILDEIFWELDQKSYLGVDILTSQVKDQVREDVRNWFESYGNYSRDQRLYLYLLTEVDRKYFTSEISTERIYATNRFPFLDDEFVEFIFTAPFAGVYSHTIKPTIENRFKSQEFYAYIIKKYKPELLKYYTDHGFPPGDLLKPLSLAHIGPKYLISRAYKKITHYDEFRPKKWMADFYPNYKAILLTQPSIYNETFTMDLTKGLFHENLTEFNKIAALTLWYQTIQNRSDPFVQ